MAFRAAGAAETCSIELRQQKTVGVPHGSLDCIRAGQDSEAWWRVAAISLRVD